MDDWQKTLNEVRELAPTDAPLAIELLTGVVEALAENVLAKTPDPEAGTQ
jgi:hypothetical protein